MSLERRNLTYTLLSPNAIVPQLRICSDIGFNIFSSEDKIIAPSDRMYVETDIVFNFPNSYYGLLISTPENASKYGIDVGQSAVGPNLESIKVLLINNSNDTFAIKRGDHIAIMLVNKYFDHYLMIQNV